MALQDAVALHCRDAIDAIERALAERPNDPERHLSQCSRALAAARDALIERRRSAASDERSAPQAHGHDPETLRLRHVNATLSLVASCEMPIQGTRWSRIEGARDALQRLGHALKV